MTTVRITIEIDTKVGAQWVDVERYAEALFDVVASGGDHEQTMAYFVSVSNAVVGTADTYDVEEVDE